MTMMHLKVVPVQGVLFLITADKHVILCACRDTHRYMKIGHLDEQDLKDIVSYENQNLWKWINDQEKNIYEVRVKHVICIVRIYAQISLKQ